MQKRITSPFRTATIDGQLRIVYADTREPCGEVGPVTRAEALAIFLDMRRVDLIWRAKRDATNVGA